jgi:hypothetical protein
MTKWLARDNYQQYLLFNLNNAPWPDRKPHSIFIVPAPIVRHWILLSLKKHPAAYGHTLPSALKTQLIKIVRNKSAILYGLRGENIIQISIQSLHQSRALDKVYAPPRLITICSVRHTIQASNAKVRFLMYCRSASTFARVASMPSA